MSALPANQATALRFPASFGGVLINKIILVFGAKTQGLYFLNPVVLIRIPVVKNNRHKLAPAPELFEREK
ncbi:MAG: hypothetical protein A2X34_05905 [Elusimicrobia bacterium GWC2_51_8]|nr:MAG: hypothetical protein A2X33_07085 [Elusimicrobia bacterium GWA2_51_34]OGR64966.1 MAG: hypothetical protein A2X34_05905 [Elusimicrobia bacterium GWC2_51_8]HAF95335.1 hypothetical protein [Elusimicrobiota bacterium]HCE96892.1 hypothetical protein [Elusimicrobiota bacterium]